MVLPSNEDKTVKEALHLIDQGWSHLHSQIKQNVIFVLGGTGAGKSTVTEIITGDLTKLHSIPGQHGTGLVIVDEVPAGGSSEGRIGDPQVSSKTFLPEYLTSRDDPSLVFVDCPGFNDNRGTHMDIAAMVLIKKIAEQVNCVRFVFVVPYSSVSYSNMQRNDFLSLCSHATSFIRDLDKVRDSMCLVITKVNNCDPASGRKIEDDVVKSEANHFLKEVAYHPSTSEENRNFVEFLLRDDSKWALMRYPCEEGPLSGIPHFPEVRKQILEICRGKLKCATVDKNDFAVTISSESKYIIRKRLILYMKEEIDKMVESLVKIIEVRYVTRVESQLKSDNTSYLVGTVRKLFDNCEKLRGQEMGSDNSSSSSANKVCEVAQWLDHVNLPEVRIKELKKVEEQLKLFGDITEETDLEIGASMKITILFGNLRLRLQDLYKETLKSIREDKVPNVEYKIKKQVEMNIKQFEETYKTEIDSLLEEDIFCRKVLDKLHSDWNTLEQLDGDGGVGGKLSEVINKIWVSVQTEINYELLKELINYENELDMLLELIDRKTGYYINGVPNILVKVRNAVGAIRTEVHQKVKEDKVKLVHEQVGNTTASVICSLEDAFFKESFYPGLDISTLESKRQVLVNIHNQLQKSKGRFNGIVESVREVFRIFGLEIPETGEDILGECEQLLDFYDERLGNPVDRPMDEWMSYIRSFSDGIRDLNIFYEFLELSKSASSGILADFEVYEFDDRETIVAKFLEAFRASSEIRRVVEQRAGLQEITLIVELVTYLQNGRTKIQCGGDDSSEKIIIKGRHVKFSDFLSETGEVSWENSVNKVVILAGESVHFDRDLRGTGKELNLTVIADKWIVKGIQRNIHLSGSCGLNPKESKAKSGQEFGESGSCGKPGTCGGNGGNFIGIYRKVDNSKSLCIYANGGNGGDGQDGGDGFRGKEIRAKSGVPGFLGVLAIFPTFPSVGGADTICGGSGGGEEKGGDGGHGGAAGLPGFAGSIKLYGVGEETAQLGSVCCSDGDPGKPGKGGVGGRGGRQDGGLGISSILKQGIVRSFPGGNGMNGLDGINTRGQCTPEVPQFVGELDWRDVEEFRRYVMEECPGSSIGENLLKLIDSHHGRLSLKIIQYNILREKVII